MVATTLASQAVVPILQERIARLDGEPRDVEIALASLPDHGRTTVQMVLTDITERERGKREIERSRSELRRLAASLVDAREEERKRIARELHDELGQRLTALKMELSALQPPAASGLATPAQQHLTEALAMLDDTVATVRRIATHLRPAMLDDLGLVAAIEWLARDFSRHVGVAVQLQLQLEDDDSGLSDTQTTALYRMVQEALTNIARHAKAKHALVSLQRDGRELVLRVQDDGVGISPDALRREGSHGLMGLRERALGLDGQLSVERAPEGGTCVTVRLPLSTRPVARTEPRA
jgi:signal transduction histidine kinase